MIGTRLDDTDAPRLIRSERGWWFIGNGTWTLLRSDQVGPDGKVSAAADTFLHQHGAYRSRTPKSFVLTVLTSTNCNLGCGYCFQNTALDPTGGHQPPRIAQRRLDAATTERIARFARGRMDAAGLDRLHLILFGGEPLLNPRGCVRLLEQVAPLGLRTATMISNGSLLTPRLAAALYGAGLRGVQVTFDGSREDHDRIRVKHTGGATFDTIVRNIGRATEATGLRWNLRVNVSHHNFERISALFDQLEGKVDPSRCTVTFAWVGDAGFGYGNSLRHIDQVSDAFVGWSVTALDAGYQVVRPSMRTTCQTCSTPGGLNGAVVNADGTLYSSWQSAGKPGFEVGTVDQGYLETAGVKDRWVTCGYEYEQVDPAVADDFQDRVDGRVLDHLYASGRL